MRDCCGTCRFFDGDSTSLTICMRHHKYVLWTWVCADHRSIQ